MGRSTKFHFPLPASRKINGQDQIESPSTDTTSPAIRESIARSSKADRLLGTTDAHSTPQWQSLRAPRPPLDSKPSYMSVSAMSDSRPGTATEGVPDGSRNAPSQLYGDESLLLHRWQGTQSRASSNVLGAPYRGETTADPSIMSFSARGVSHKSSFETLQNPEYDHKKFLQTSASAMRDMALRNGQTDPRHHGPRPGSTHSRTSRKSRKSGDDLDADAKRKRPARLDLSKLFNRPKTSDAKVPSPTHRMDPLAPISASSENQRNQAGSNPAGKKGSKRSPNVLQKKSPVTPPAPPRHQPRTLDRDPYDNPKVNTRKPPPGVQHWFDAISDDDEEESTTAGLEDSPAPSSAAKFSPSAPNFSRGPAPYSPDKMRTNNRDRNYTSHLSPDSRQVASSSSENTRQQRRPSLHSVNSKLTNTSTKTRDSTFSNLHDASVLSFSSSEDENDYDDLPGYQTRGRESIITSTSDGFVTGKRRQYPNRTSSVSTGPNMTRWRSITDSTVSGPGSASTGKFNIIPSSPSSAHLSVPPRNPNRKQSRQQMQHARQPSSIPEDRASSPHLGITSPTTSMYSVASIKSEPSMRNHIENNRMIQVSEEEWAFLEMMRQKRAAIQKYGQKPAMKIDTQVKKKPSDEKTPRTSAFLSLDSPQETEAPPLPLPPPVYRQGSQDTPHVSPSTNLVRNRNQQGPGHGVGDDVERTDYFFEDHAQKQGRPHAPNGVPSPEPSPKGPYHISAGPTLSPLDLFPAPFAVARSETQTPPLHSPTTPGDSSASTNSDINIRVITGSEASSSADDSDVQSHSARHRTPYEHHNVSLSRELASGSPSVSTRSSKSKLDSTNYGTIDTQRLSIYKTGQEYSRDVSPASTRTLESLYGADGFSSVASSIAEYPGAIPQVEQRRTGSRRTSSQNRAPMSTLGAGMPSERRSRRVSRGVAQNSFANKRTSTVSGGTRNSRSSVSEDVLAAWGSLGGAI